jgi:Nucleotide modification associated domain 3
MKIILSRKGFDSTSGGVPSPIFEDGTMISLPIPRKSDVSYGELKNPCNNGKFRSLGELVEQLTNYRMSEHCRAHLDPDLNPAMMQRLPNWRGIFGQNEKAEETLKNVRPGDLFLFFGLFQIQRVLRNRENGRYEHDSSQPEMHVIHGWLMVEEKYRIPEDMERIPTWAKYHPHITFRDIEKSPNVIYIAAERLASDSTVPGWGVFPKFREELRLSHPEPYYKGAS